MNRTVLPIHVLFLYMRLQYEPMETYPQRQKLNSLTSPMSSMTLHMEPACSASRNQETYTPES
jgi:hypothetical protein